MDEEEEKKKFETEENDGKGKKNTLDKEALCERLITLKRQAEESSQLCLSDSKSAKNMKN